MYLIVCLFSIGTTRKSRTHDLKVAATAIGGGHELSRSKNRSRSAKPPDGSSDNPVSFAQIEYIESRFQE